MGKPLDNLDKYDPWMLLWSDYLTNTLHFNTSSEKEHTQEVIQNVLLSHAQGNSCLSIEPTTVKRLRSLVAFDKKSYTCPFVFDGKFIYLYRYYALEQRLASQVVRLIQQPEFQLDICAYENLLIDKYQQQALKMVVNHHLGIITGGPGTGKTYTLARIIAVLNKITPNLRIAMAAPTGKAAQRMQEALQQAFEDPILKEKELITPALQRIQPITLHRLLGLGTSGIAKFNLKQPLPFDVIVVDEASMLDLNLATLLFEAVADGARLILLGDANQLASVGVGSVLADLQQIEKLRNYRTGLVYSRRFSDDAKIGKMAKFIQQVAHASISDHEQLLQRFNEELVVASSIRQIDLDNIEQDDLQLEYLPIKMTEREQENSLEKLWLGYQGYVDAVKAYSLAEDDEDLHQIQQQILDCFNDYRVLTAMNVGVLGVKGINQFIEKQLKHAVFGYSNQHSDWYVGRPIMVTENDYQLGVSNGDIGICFWHRHDQTQYEVFFPSLNKWILATRLPKTIQTAFAMTIHKSQGSEFKHVAVLLEKNAQNLLSRELFYTAITRAKKMVTLFVDPQALTTALLVKTVRQSGLCLKIDNLIKAIDIE